MKIYLDKNDNHEINLLTFYDCMIILRQS